MVSMTGPMLEFSIGTKPYSAEPVSTAVKTSMKAYFSSVVPVLRVPGAPMILGTGTSSTSPKKSLVTCSEAGLSLCVSKGEKDVEYLV